MKKYNFVYKTTNLINKKIYVGVHSTDNLDDWYLGSGKRLLLAIRKYGKENFKREIISFVDSREDGNTFSVSKDDPRYLSGELVGVMKGRKYKINNKPKDIICPHCNKKGSPSNMKRWHFDNCKFKQ